MTVPASSRRTRAAAAEAAADAAATDPTAGQPGRRDTSRGELLDDGSERTQWISTT